MLEVRYEGSVYLPGPGLHLDPRKSSQWAFVSHAHADHFGRHERVLCSSVTATLLRERFGLSEQVIEPLGWGEAREEGGYRFQLLPAGHIFGSAMLHLTRLEDGASLLYTGDFKVRRSRTAEEPVFRQAQTLIMETTFALSHYVFPSALEIEARVIGFVEDTLEAGEIPILFAYSLGKAQEAHAMLHEHGIRVMLHPAVAKMQKACELAGMSPLPYEVLDVSAATGRALVCPPNAVRSVALRKLKGKRTAMLSGWAMNPGATFRYRTDAAFPLSDHADHPGLWECVRRVNPSRVLTLHGYAREFASELREGGIDAWSVFGNDQMELGLTKKSEVVERRSLPRPCSELSFLSDLCESIAGVGSRWRKVELLADYFSTLRRESLPLATRFLAGKPLIDRGEFIPLQLGAAAIRLAVLAASGVNEARYRELSKSQAELARTVRLVLEESTLLQPKALTLIEVEMALRALSLTRGVDGKSARLAKLLRELHPREAEMLVRVVTGGLRIGLKEGLLDDALAKAFGCSVSEVREAHMLLGEVGELAVLAAEGRLANAELRPMTPIKVMLASPEETARGISDRLGDLNLWVEDKFDGIRVQVHKVGEDVSLFSRDLRPLNDQFPELIRQIAQGDSDFILDGELIAFAEGRRLNFFDLQKRLGSKSQQGDLFLGESVPVRVVAFDLLWCQGESLIKRSLEQRRKQLDALILPLGIERIEVARVDGESGLEAAFKSSKSAGNEGLIVKDPASLYQPGRRGKSWLKLKKAMPTLDCVVVKAQQGHGKRAELLSDYTFAVRDAETSALRVIGKAYSGLTDVEIEELTEHFKTITQTVRRRVHEVKPEVILEIAFDSIRRSKRHDSGLALRFPRIKAIRRDKTCADIDTLQYAESLLQGK